MIEKKRVEFAVTVTKAWRDTRLTKSGFGRPHIEAVASDTSIDSYREYFSESALQDMVTYSRMRKTNKPNEGLVELRSTHWDTFSMGWVEDAWIETNQETKFVELHVDLVLKEDNSYAMELFNEVLAGIADKQLSVGGWIDWEKGGDSAYEEVSETFSDEDGNAITVWVGKINRFILEHIACTLPGWAANSNTGFLSAIVKSAFTPQLQNSASWMPGGVLGPRTKTEGSENEKETTSEPMKKTQHSGLKGLINKITSVLTNAAETGLLSLSTEELEVAQMPNPGEETTVVTGVEPVVDEESTITVEQPSATETQPVATDEVVAAPMSVEATPVVADASGSVTPETAEATTDSTSQDVSSLLAELSAAVKAISEAMKGLTEKQNALEERLGSISTQTTSISEKSVDIENRLSVMETQAGVSKSASVEPEKDSQVVKQVEATPQPTRMPGSWYGF